MDDVVIVGAGPAGALAAIILARAGRRVRVFDRARFPRHKLCGDTLNPGALDVLRRHLDIEPLIAKSSPIHGMLLTGPAGAQVHGSYGQGIAGRSITRAAFDEWLLQHAMNAGAQIEQGANVRDVDSSDGRVIGVLIGHHGHTAAHRAGMVIAADGRRSIAIHHGLSRQPPRPRRWAIGGYFSDVAGMTSVGEMHVRRRHYIGVAPLPGGLTNACLVVPHESGDPPLTDPATALRNALSADPSLRARFADARAVAPAVMLGPMAVDAAAAGAPGLLLAGDAAGFIDPMTGDGLRFALKGAELAATVAEQTLSGRWRLDRAHVELAEQRRVAFARKWRFNRALRRLVSSPASVTAAATVAHVLPPIFAAMIRYAGDCPEPTAPVRHATT
jgi:menaquinone-9 beta-reductase